MRDYHQEMTDGIIAAIEKGVAPWQKPWNANAVPPIPINPTTGKQYRGGNVLWLMCEAVDKGYDDPRWMTFKQAQEHGWQVRKGQHGTCIAYWKRTETIKERDPATGEEVKKEVPLERPVPFYAVVFNAQQVQGIPPLESREVVWNPVERAEAILSGSGARIMHDGGNRAFYRPATDDIHLPARAEFPNAGDYYDTALHELGHWTGRSDRLNRLTEARFGSTDYAKEELRAEIASFFIGVEIGLPHNTEKHAAYVGSWIKVLKEDKFEIFRAARDAEKIEDYLLSKELSREQQANQDARKEEASQRTMENSVIQSSREELIKAAPLIQGTLYAHHIEEPKEIFRVAVLRSSSWNVLYKPEHWEGRRVLAETPEGAMKIAQYHFYLGRDFQYLGRENKNEITENKDLDQVQPELSGVYGEKIEIRTQIDKNEYEWRPGIIVEAKDVTSGGKCYEVLPDGNDPGQVISVSENEVRQPLLYGQIDYLGSNGEVGETIYFEDKQSFDKEAHDSACCGRPIDTRAYRDNVSSKEQPAYWEDVREKEAAATAEWDRGDGR